MIEIIDDVLPKEQYDTIYELLTNPETFWQWAPSTVEGVEAPDTPQLVRPIYMDQEASNTKTVFNELSAKYPEFQNISICAMQKSKRQFVDINKFIRIKANALTPWPNAPRFHPPHTDTDAPNGLSCLFYLHDCDGDTFFFGEENITVTPKANRAVLFDAYHKHASSNPINNDRRIIVNSVLIVEEEK